MKPKTVLRILFFQHVFICFIHILLLLTSISPFLKHETGSRAAITKAHLRFNKTPLTSVVEGVLRQHRNEARSEVDAGSSEELVGGCRLMRRRMNKGLQRRRMVIVRWLV